MHPLSIILAFAFLGSLVVLGAVLVGFGAWRLRDSVHVGNPVRLSGVATLSLRSLLIALGLLLVVYGILGTYRIIWGA